jgi:hypothetical protein
MSHMKNNWKVLPFHIVSKDSCGDIVPKYKSAGFRKYSSAKGIMNAISGEILTKRLRVRFFFCTLVFSISPITARMDVVWV